MAAARRSQRVREPAPPSRRGSRLPAAGGPRPLGERQHLGLRPDRDRGRELEEGAGVVAGVVGDAAEAALPPQEVVVEGRDPVQVDRVDGHRAAAIHCPQRRHDDAAGRREGHGRVQRGRAAGRRSRRPTSPPAPGHAPARGRSAWRHGSRSPSGTRPGSRAMPRRRSRTARAGRRAGSRRRRASDTRSRRRTGAARRPGRRSRRGHAARSRPVRPPARRSPRRDPRR